MQSKIKISNKIVTTAEVIEYPTFFEPPLTVSPHTQLTIDKINPKIMDLKIDLRKS